jgi:dephospho-CoA kinase
MRVAITGNIGSGKSTLTKLLSKILKEYRLISVDEIVGSLYDEEIFCQTLTTRFGTCDKKQVSDIVFANAEQRKWLEQECIKRVRSIMNWQIGQHTNVLVEFPLLFENSAQINYQHVITAYCDDAVQIERVKSRNGFSEEKIRSIMGAQLSTDLKKLLANDAVDTNCTMDELQEKAQELATKIRVQDLRNRFINLFGVDYSSIDNIWKALEQAYQEPHRFYHVLAHLAYMFHLYDTVKNKLKYPKIVALAIWFHDFVYRTDEEYANNEMASVKAMFDLLQKHLGPNISAMMENDLPMLAVAGEFILSTKGHEVKSPYLLANEDLLHDCEVFLDLDLSVLVGDAYTLKWFEQGIRKEFVQYDNKAYGAGRADALSAFAKRPKVMLSEYFTDKNDLAKQNLIGMIKRADMLATWGINAN